MKLLYVRHDDTDFARLAGELERQGAVLCSNTAAAIERLAEGGFEGIVLPGPVFFHGVQEPAVRSALLGDLPLIVLLDDLPAESILAMSLNIIEQGGDDSLVGSHVDAATVLERLKIARLRRRFELATVAAESGTTRRTISGFTAGAPQLSAPPARYGVGPQRRFRVLHVEADPGTVYQVAIWLEDLPSAVVAVSRLADAIEQLRTGTFDAVLVDHDLAGGHGAYVVQMLRRCAGAAVVVAAHATPAWDQVELAISAGAQDCVVTSRWTRDDLWRALLCSAARQRRPRATGLAAGGERPRASTLSVLPTDERRKFPRYILTKPAVVIPILPDRAPDGAFRGDGLTCDVSQCGIGFEVVGLDRLPGRHLLVGVEGNDEAFYYATVEVRHHHQLAGRLRVGATFVPPEDEILRPDNLLPTFQPKTYRFATGLATEILEKWAAAGVLRPFLADRLLLCPKCRTVPTFRHGCGRCGSVRTATYQLIHHFACAYVGPAHDFALGNELVCPKCRTRGLVVGADFEYLQSPYRCMECGGTGTELEIVGQCLACHAIFALNQAWEDELIGYHANRLEPLALIDSA